MQPARIRSTGPGIDQPQLTPTLNTAVLRAAGDRSFSIRVQVAGAEVAVDSGTVSMLANGTPVGSKAIVTLHGWGTVRWNPPASTARGTYRLRVRYDGTDKDVTAGISPHPFTVRVR